MTIEGYTTSNPGNEAVLAAGHAHYQFLDAVAFEIADGQWIVCIDGKLVGFKRGDA